MNEQLIYQLLKILKHNGNIWEIINKGYNFGQVTYFIENLKTKNYIFNDESGKTLVTSTGDAFISGFEANNRIQQYSKWILPRSEMWHKPVGATFVYIPKE